MAGACLGGPGASGCRRAEKGPPEPGAAEPPVTRVPLEDVPDGGRLRVLLGGRPVELRRSGGQVVARSLVCTHFACEVHWDPEDEVYACPCHDGAFAPDGRVLAGPPNRPLPEVPVVVDGPEVVLEG